MRLPPLNALRAFEAAARHGGFIEAAAELHVTRGAISRHVKLLEDHLGRALFHRTARGVTLTRAGADLLPVLTDAFRRIAEGASRVADRTGIRVICPPATSIRWLLPRLGAFQQNTLESNANNLRATLENTIAAESVVRDTDFAEEIANFTKQQVLLQAGSTVLGNANQIPQLVASLLRG